MSFSCPLCHQPLSREKNSYICPQRHQFDMAKEGYVNLLPVQHKRSRDPGDSAEMMQARRAFLDAGHYQPLRDAIVAQLRERLDEKATAVLDIGCGEGYYTHAFADALPEITTFGLDVSKVAIKAAAKRYPQDGWIAIERNVSVAGIAVRKFDAMHNDPARMRFIWGDAEKVDEWFGEGEIDIIHLNFSDPWPKRRAHKKRLSSQAFIARYEKILKPGGSIQMKTDNSSLFEYSILQFQDCGWRLSEFSVDYRREPHEEDVITEYEQRFLTLGQPIYRAVWAKDGGMMDEGTDE